MSFAVEVDDVSVRYGDVHALAGVSLTISPGVICGLLGRNGAGKSTLLAVIAAYRRANGGRVHVDGEDPYEDARLMSEICLVRSEGDFEPGTSVAEVLTFARDLRPHFDVTLADRLVDRFAIPRRTKTGRLSRGQRCALAVSVAIASRAPLTLFDEPHLGMDVPNRYAFYDELIADYSQHPRTIILSTHLIDEAATLFQDVVILHEGRVLVQSTADDLRMLGTEITGPEPAVSALLGASPVLAERALGPIRSAVVLDPLSDEQRARASDDGVTLAPVSLQDLFVHLTAKESS